MTTRRTPKKARASRSRQTTRTKVARPRAAKRNPAPRAKAPAPTYIVIDRAPASGFLVVDDGTPHSVETFRAAEVKALRSAARHYAGGARAVAVVVSAYNRGTVRPTKAFVAKLMKATDANPLAAHGWTERLADAPRRR